MGSGLNAFQHIYNGFQYDFEIVPTGLLLNGSFSTEFEDIVVLLNNKVTDLNMTLETP